MCYGHKVFSFYNKAFYSQASKSTPRAQLFVHLINQPHFFMDFILIDHRNDVTVIKLFNTPGKNVVDLFFCLFVCFSFFYKKKQKQKYLLANW